MLEPHSPKKNLWLQGIFQTTDAIKEALASITSKHLSYKTKMNTRGNIGEAEENTHFMADIHYIFINRLWGAICV